MCGRVSVFASLKATWKGEGYVFASLPLCPATTTILSQKLGLSLPHLTWLCKKGGEEKAKGFGQNSFFSHHLRTKPMFRSLLTKLRLQCPVCGTEVSVMCLALDTRLVPIFSSPLYFSFLPWPVCLPRWGERPLLPRIIPFREQMFKGHSCQSLLPVLCPRGNSS